MLNLVWFSPFSAITETESFWDVGKWLLFDLTPVSNDWVLIHFRVIVQSDSGSSECCVEFFEHDDESVEWVGWVLVECGVERCWSWEAEVLNVSLSSEPVVLPLCLNSWCLNCGEGNPLPDVKTTGWALGAFTEDFLGLISPFIPVIETFDQDFGALFKFWCRCNFNSYWLNISYKIEAVCLVVWPVVELIFETHLEGINRVDHFVVHKLLQVEDALPLDELFRLVAHSNDGVTICCIGTIVCGIWQLSEFPVNIGRDAELVVLVL